MNSTQAIYPALAGQVVFVSGGASGIGEAIVEAFWQQGAKVAFCDLDESAGHALCERLGATAEGRFKPWFGRCDVRDIEAYRAVLDNAAQALGAIHTLVNNAGRDTRHALDNLIGYTASKAAISGITRTLARELGDGGIRVNAVLPGAVVTPRQTALWRDAASDQQFIDLQCLKFRVEPKHIADSVLFLASPQAAAITGQNLLVDAGLAQVSVVG
jgi:NAD(P)-dependent dehydrogenase (short-subunit alcohol dehydrogenase family)